MKTQRFKPSPMTDADVAPPAPAAPSHHQVFFQNRLQNFGLTMVVMGACFALYYLGFFGGVPGPLTPEHIGDTLAALGFSNRRLLHVFLVLAVISLSWNWLYNAVNRMLGRHMLCTYMEDGRSSPCNKQIQIKKSDWEAGLYVCRDGHMCPEVRTNIVRKGTISHFLWMMWLIFSVIVFYLS